MRFLSSAIAVVGLMLGVLLAHRLRHWSYSNRLLVGVAILVAGLCLLAVGYSGLPSLRL